MLYRLSNILGATGDAPTLWPFSVVLRMPVNNWLNHPSRVEVSHVEASGHFEADAKHAFNLICIIESRLGPIDPLRTE